MHTVIGKNNYLSFFQIIYFQTWKLLKSGLNHRCDLPNFNRQLPLSAMYTYQ